METPIDKLLLNAPEVAAILNISRALAYRWMQDGTLPVLRAPVGRVVRVPRVAAPAGELRKSSGFATKLPMRSRKREARF